MERITFFDRYRISVGADGTPRELYRSGAATTYKAVDLQSGEPVALKIVPMDSVQPDLREEFEERARAAQRVDHLNVARVLAFIVDAGDYVLVSEYPAGDTIASWVSAHGPLTADAALRVALQVVNGLQAAAFHGLTHPAIDPSNLVIVPGQTADGGWPAIKLINLDSAGLRFVADNADRSAHISPQFASPEQLRGASADFRSEIYSLGASMCFMLTGAAPLSSDDGSARLPAGLRKVPRSVRDLLLDMLRSDPEERPQDPVAVADRITDVLASVERRRVIAPTPTVVPSAGVLGASRVDTTPRFIPRGFARAAMIAAGCALVALLLALPIRAAWRRHQDVARMGVPVGVPEPVASAAATDANSPAPAAPVARATAQPPAVAASEPPVLESQQDRTEVASAPAQAATPTAEASQQTPDNRVASTSEKTNAATPAEGPAETERPLAPPTDPHPTTRSESVSNRAEKTERTVAVAQPDADSNPQPAEGQSKAVPSAAPVAKRQQPPRVASNSRRASTVRDHENAPRVPRGSQRARFVGTTPDGEWIFEAPAGTGTADLPDEEPAPRHRRQRVTEGEEIVPVEREPMVLPALPPDE